MKKMVLSILLIMTIVFSLVACNTTKVENENDITKDQEDKSTNEYYEFIKEGDKLVADGEMYQAEEAYIRAKNNNPNLEEAYYKLLSVYATEYDVKNKNAIIKEIDKNNIDMSDELKKLIEEEREKDWFPINVTVRNSDGELEISGAFEYDSIGRIIKSKIGTIPMEDDYILGSDYEYTYLEDGSIKISEFYEGSYRESWIYKFDNFGRVVSKQSVYSDGTGPKPIEYNYESDDATIPYDSSATYDEYGFLTSNSPSSKKFFVNECDRYGNLIRKYVYLKGRNIATYSSGGSKVVPNVTTKYEDSKLLQYQEYTYVYCKPEELQGDLSDFPKSEVSQNAY